MANGLEKRSYVELVGLQQKIADAIVAKKEEEKVALKQQLKELAANSGFELSDLMGNERSSRKGNKIAVKYRHPKDASLTWTGRGRKPLWLVAELEKGRKLEGFSVE